MNVAEAITHAELIARRKIADRCRTDLYYLCSSILGYNLMTPSTHGDLCHMAESIIKPHTTAESEEYVPIVEIKPTSNVPTKNLQTINLEDAAGPEMSVGDIQKIQDKFDDKELLILIAPRNL